MIILRDMRDTNKKRCEISKNCDIIVIGAGPAGLAAAYELSVRNGVACVVLDKSSRVGGLSATVEHNGYRMDIGPHRFFTKNDEVSALWNEVLESDFTERDRTTRIYYENIFFNYPLTASEIPFKLGLWRTFGVGMSYIKRHLLPLRPEDDFESWVRNRFGDALYDMFFKEYTKKVWGVNPTKIDAEWAAQRIRALSLAKIAADMLKLSGKSKQTSLISKFHYPRLGAGQMYEAMAAKIAESGSEIILGAEVDNLKCESDGSVTVSARIADSDGKKSEIRDFRADKVVSSMPLDELTAKIADVDEKTATLAAGLTYRSLVTVNLMFETMPPVPDHWIYLNSSDVKAGRMDLFHNFSQDMVSKKGNGCVGMEYFCDPGDDVWTASDDTMTEMALNDISKIKFTHDLKPSDINVVRYAKAYPCYFGDYADRLSGVKSFLKERDAIIPVGRYGQFRYNNMDHSIVTGLLAARKIMGADVDPWCVNEDAEYHEEK